jgi:hypothetical protein
MCVCVWLGIAVGLGMGDVGEESTDAAKEKRPLQQQ